MTYFSSHNCVFEEWAALRHCGSLFLEVCGGGFGHHLAETVVGSSRGGRWLCLSLLPPRAWRSDALWEILCVLIEWNCMYRKGHAVWGQKYTFNLSVLGDFLFVVSKKQLLFNFQLNFCIEKWKKNWKGFKIYLTAIYFCVYSQWPFPHSFPVHGACLRANSGLGSGYKVSNRWDWFLEAFGQRERQMYMGVKVLPRGERVWKVRGEEEG